MQRMRLIKIKLITNLIKRLFTDWIPKTCLKLNWHKAIGPVSNLAKLK